MTTNMRLGHCRTVSRSVLSLSTAFLGSFALCPFGSILHELTSSFRHQILPQAIPSCGETCRELA